MKTIWRAGLALLVLLLSGCGGDYGAESWENGRNTIGDRAGNNFETPPFCITGRCEK